MSPSRLLWFAFGAGFAACWIKRKEYHTASDRWGHCRRPVITHPHSFSNEYSRSDPEKRAPEFERLRADRGQEWNWDDDKFMKQVHPVVTANAYFKLLTLLQLNELTEVSLDMVISVTQLMKDVSVWILVI
jgi:hypothetical protein